jgi:hypothetical protein
MDCVRVCLFSFLQILAHECMNFAFCSLTGLGETTIEGVLRVMTSTRQMFLTSGWSFGTLCTLHLRFCMSCLCKLYMFIIYISILYRRFGKKKWS